jgi:hypothetical protein
MHIGHRSILLEDSQALEDEQCAIRGELLDVESLIE